MIKASEDRIQMSGTGADIMCEYAGITEGLLRDVPPEALAASIIAVLKDDDVDKKKKKEFVRCLKAGFEIVGL